MAPHGSHMSPAWQILENHMATLEHPKKVWSGTTPLGALDTSPRCMILGIHFDLWGIAMSPQGLPPHLAPLHTCHMACQVSYPSEKSDQTCIMASTWAICHLSHIKPRLTIKDQPPCMALSLQASHPPAAALLFNILCRKIHLTRLP